MRILFTGKHPPGGRARHGGVHSWIATMVSVCEALGHECAIWGPELPAPSGRFDLGVVSNARATGEAARWCDRIIGVSHGIIPDERPEPSFLSVFTSEEVRKFWGSPGPVLRQPIDLEFWSPGDSEAENLLTFYSYRAPMDLGLDKVAAALGMRFARLKNVTPCAAREALRRSRVVAATGRAALEAMACGAVVLICDWRLYQGPLFDPDAYGAMARNYSGRGGVGPTMMLLKKNILERMDDPPAAPVLHLRRHHDARRIAQELLEHAVC